ncbi:hypothetical protein CEV33_4840, partial [Brucella grignonensis]
LLCYALWHADPHAKVLGIVWMLIGVVVALGFYFSDRPERDEG